MTSIQIIRNGSLAKAKELQMEEDALKQAAIDAAAAVEQEILEAEAAKKQAKLAKEAERFAAKVQLKRAAKEACSRCYRAGFMKSCVTHVDAECIKPFCECCYDNVVEQKLDSRRFTTHDIADCILAPRIQQAKLRALQEAKKVKLAREGESEGAYLRLMQKDREERLRREKAEEIVRREEHARKLAEMKKRAQEQAHPEQFAACAAIVPLKKVSEEETQAIWQKKAAEAIAERQKQLEEEEAQRQAEEDALKAAKMAEIAKKKARISELRTKIRDAKAKAEDKKISKTQQKKAVKDAKVLEKEDKTLSFEITIDERQLREALKQIRK
jgi:hypothetical protein